MILSAVRICCIRNSKHLELALGHLRIALFAETFQQELFAQRWAGRCEARLAPRV